MILKYNESEQRMVRMVRPGYSLIEIMIAIAIVGVLFGGVMYLGNMVMENANRSSTRTTLQLIKFAVKGYQQEKGKYPKNLEEAVAADFLKKPLPKDGWNQPSFYRATEDGFELYSHGPQGKKGGKASRIKP